MKSNQLVIKQDLAEPNCRFFQLLAESENGYKEKTELVTNCDRLKNLKYSSVSPYVFTEQGIAMLSVVLHSETPMYWGKYI